MLRIIGRSSVGGGGGGKRVEYQGGAHDSVNRTTYTFASQALGDEDGNRYIVVGITDYGVVGDVSSVTINGVSASEIVDDFPSGGGYTQLWGALVTTGTTGDIVVTKSSTGVEMSIHTWALYGLTSTTAYDTSAGQTTGAYTATLDIPADGMVVMMVAEVQAGAGTWAWSGGTLTDADEDYDAVTGGAQAGASADTLPSAVSATLTATESGGRNGSFAAASWT